MPKVDQADLDNLSTCSAAVVNANYLTRLQPVPTLLKVLIVDDLEDALAPLRALLELYSVDVRTASNGREAILVGLKWEPHLLITDIQMPEMDGRHVARRLKISLPQLVAIAVSGLPPNLDFKNDDNLVFDHYLVKPVDFNYLCKLLDSYAHLPQADNHSERRDELSSQWTELFPPTSPDSLP